MFGRLDIAVYHALGVCGRQCAGDFLRNAQQFLNLERFPRNAVPECEPFKIFHGDEDVIAMLANLVDGANVGMTQ